MYFITEYLLFSNLQKKDVAATKRLLESCFHFYYNLQLMPDYEIKEIPLQCRKHNAVYNIIHYLVDTTFLPLSLVRTKDFLNIIVRTIVEFFYNSCTVCLKNYGLVYFKTF